MNIAARISVLFVVVTAIGPGAASAAGPAMTGGETQAWQSRLQRLDAERRAYGTAAQPLSLGRRLELQQRLESQRRAMRHLQQRQAAALADRQHHSRATPGAPPPAVGLGQEFRRQQDLLEFRQGMQRRNWSYGGPGR